MSALWTWLFVLFQDVIVPHDKQWWHWCVWSAATHQRQTSKTQRQQILPAILKTSPANSLSCEMFDAFRALPKQVARWELATPSRSYPLSILISSYIGCFKNCCIHWKLQLCQQVPDVSYAMMFNHSERYLDDVHALLCTHMHLLNGRSLKFAFKIDGISFEFSWSL